MGLVGVLKIGNTQLAWCPHMGGIQVATEWEVHAAPLGAKKHDGAFGAYPRGWNGLPSPLCLRLQPNFDYGPFEGAFCQEVDLLMWIEILSSENCLPAIWRFEHRLRFVENGGMHGGQRHFVP